MLKEALEFVYQTFSMPRALQTVLPLAFYITFLSGKAFVTQTIALWTTVSVA